MNKKIYFFIGTTAEFIKLAPIIREFRKRGVEFKMITSGQTKVLFKDLRGYAGDIKVDIAFKEKGEKSSIFLFGFWAIRTIITASISLRKEFKGLNKRNSYFIIHGDTVSSLIGVVIAKIHGLKIVHIESGLRSYNFREPFPEEICRYVIIHLADILFPPTEWALGNLKFFSGEKICTKQNTLIEPCLWAIKKRKVKDRRLSKYYILTMHRQEHVLFRKEWTKNTMKFIIKNAKSNLNCILITHHLTTTFLKNFDPSERSKNKVIILPRLPYVEFMLLMKDAEFIATDGCTNQEEAYYMGLPLLALRDRTERIEGLGENIVLARDKKSVIKNFMKEYKKYRRKTIHFNMRPSRIVVEYLMSN